MHHPSRLLFGFLLLWAMLPAFASAAPEKPLQPGIYIRTGDTGTLSLRRSGTGTLEFELDTLGVNASSCSAAGPVSGRIATASPLNEERPDEVCRLALETQGPRTRVRVLTRDTCADHCGARAWLEGDFRLPPESCTSAAITQRRALFLKQYRAKQHAQAVQTAQSLLTQCADFLFWITQDGIRSDLALAQLRAGQPQACLATLERTAAGKVSDADGLRSDLPPLDYDNYEWADAIWHNRRLCQQAISGDAGWLDPIKGRLEPDAARQWAEQGLAALRATRSDAEALGPNLHTDWSPLLMFKADGRRHAALLRLQTAEAAVGAESAAASLPAGRPVQLGLQLFREEAMGWVELRGGRLLSPVLSAQSETLELLRWGDGHWGLRWQLDGGNTQFFAQLWPAAPASGILWRRSDGWDHGCPPSLGIQDLQPAIEQAMSRQGAGPAGWQDPSHFCGLQFEQELLQLVGRSAPVLKLHWYGIEVDAQGLRRSAIRTRHLMLADGQQFQPGSSSHDHVEPAQGASQPKVVWNPRDQVGLPSIVQLEP